MENHAEDEVCTGQRLDLPPQSDGKGSGRTDQGHGVLLFVTEIMKQTNRSDVPLMTEKYTPCHSCLRVFQVAYIVALK